MPWYSFEINVYPISFVGYFSFILNLIFLLAKSFVFVSLGGPTIKGLSLDLRCDVSLFSLDLFLLYFDRVFSQVLSIHSDLMCAIHLAISICA